MKKPILHKNASPYGWWIAKYLEIHETQGHELTDASRCEAWENTIVINAPSREQAYRKALRFGKSGSRKWTKSGDGLFRRWRFLGLTELLPIYEVIEDGAEILWKVHKNKSFRKVKSYVKDKSKLSVFDD